MPAEKITENVLRDISASDVVCTYYRLLLIQQQNSQTKQNEPCSAARLTTGLHLAKLCLSRVGTRSHAFEGGVGRWYVTDEPQLTSALTMYYTKP